MKLKITYFILYLVLFSFQINAQQNSTQLINEEVYNLKDFVRDWACQTYLEGSYIENLEISINENKLILKSNFTQKDADFFGYPEYSKSVIDLSSITSISIQENDSDCAGIIIKTKPEGIQMIFKYRNSNSEVSMPKEKEFREKFGWKNDAIRLRKNTSFNDRSNRIIHTIEKIAILSGNTELEK